METILVAGATGHVGRHLVPMLREAGYRVRALSRTADVFSAEESVKADLTQPATLAGVCKDVGAVISCAGASLDFNDWSDRTSFMRVDFEGNRNLLDEAQLQGVRKFVYVSLYGGQKLMRAEYARAHEYMVLALENASIPYCVVRPTGFFATMVEFLNMAKRGRAVVVGRGNVRTNPIHEADVARVCLEALSGTAAEIPAGGPDTFTRREIVELAFDVAGRKPGTLSVPAWALFGAAKAVRLINPRMAGLMAFGAAAGSTDVVAPVRGRERLRAYFEHYASQPVQQAA